MTFIYLLLVLGINILVHEFGHFIFAKKAKIHVYEFSIGMGPRLFKFNRKNDETIYSVKLFPIGGSVQMAGEGVEEDSNMPREKTLQSKTWIQRFLTIVAGALFNYLLAILIFFVIALFNGSVSNETIVNYVDEAYPAYESGLRVGQKIIKVDDVKVFSNDQFLLELQMRYSKPINLTVIDNNETKVITINPTVDDKGQSKYGFFAMGEAESGFIASIKYAFTKTWNLTVQMVYILKYLFTGKIGMGSLAGPIGIYTVVDEVSRNGLWDVMYLTAFIAINLGFINLLPIPAFDGGRLVFMWIELIKGSPVNAKFENMVHAVGFVILMVLSLFVAFNDILRLMS